MSLTISIRFLTGRAHLHPWQTHHSEGRVEWPPSPWRLLRALVAVAGREFTTLPESDQGSHSKPELKAIVHEMTSLKSRSVSRDAKGKLSFSNPNKTLTLKSLISDAEAAAWKVANPDDAFAEALDALREAASIPDFVTLLGMHSDDPLSRLADLVHALSRTPTVWLPKTSGGHTRQYFPTGEPDPKRWIAPTGSPVFDTFATIPKDQPLLFHWSDTQLDDQQQADLKLLLGRMSYFGRAESWCRAETYTCLLEHIKAEGMSSIVPGQTHWECVCIEDHGKPAGQEYRDYLLERRLVPTANIIDEVAKRLPQTYPGEGNRRLLQTSDFSAQLGAERPEISLLRCLLRESGQDIKDGLERPIGTRWIHYAVPRAIYDVPRPKPQPRHRQEEVVDLVRYALNTATVNRPVLPAVADTLLVADKFRSAVMALCRPPGRAISGHERDGKPCQGHQHAHWWPLDEDNDGFIDHVMVWASGGFEQREVDALRRLTRLRQRGGRPDLHVTPVVVSRAEEYGPWQVGQKDGAKVFVSATPYFCPVHLSHGRKSSGRIRSLKREVIKGLQLQGVIKTEDEVFDVDEIVFDYAPAELVSVIQAVTSQAITQPTPPRQFFPVIEAPDEYPSLPKQTVVADTRYYGAALKDADEGYCFGTTLGLRVADGTRFIRTLSFCRRRRGHELHGRARMLQITFSRPRPPRPFAIGSQCHFGLGLFVPASGHDDV